MYKWMLLFALCSITCLYLFAGKHKHKKLPLLPKENKVYPVAIIGGGAGGTMAAKRMVLNNREVLFFIGDKKAMKRSRGHWVRKVENVPGLEKYKRTLVELRQETINNIASSEFDQNLSLVEDAVVSIKKEGDIFELRDKSGNTHFAKAIILATGMMDEQPHIQGSIRPILSYANNQTIAYCLLCDGHKSYKKKTVVIGHSEDAAKAALLLLDRYQPEKLTILTNGNPALFSEATQELLITKGIEVILEPIQTILHENKGVLAGFEFASKKQLTAEIGFVMLGIRPNNELALQLGAKVDTRGLVITNEQGESSVENLFVVGDLRSGSMKQIYTAWQHAIEATQVIDKRIRER